MKFFDLHCDTITELEKAGGSLYQNNMHISLERADIYENYTQVFAIFIPDELRGQAAVDYFDRVRDFYHKEIEENNSCISPYFENQATKMKAILSVEGGAAAAGSIEGLHHLYDGGVRLMTLTWNAQNEIASGCWAEPDMGLTPFGIECVREMEKLNMIIDVSHLSQKGFWDVAEYTTKPFVASHSNCDIADNIFAHKRNLNDSQIKCLIERGGLMGINLCGAFLGDDEKNPADISFDAVYRHISHALDIGANDILTMGCDHDGCNMAAEFAGVEKIMDIYDFLLSKNISESLCNSIFYDNANKFFKRLA